MNYIYRWHKYICGKPKGKMIETITRENNTARFRTVR